MSTYAAIYLKDEETNRYNGISVKYDGYIKDGVGEMLLNYWQNLKNVKALCNGKQTDLRALGTDLDDSEWLEDEDFGRRKYFRNLSYDEMVQESSNISYNYTYVFKKSEDGCYRWMFLDRDKGDMLIPLEDVDFYR